MEEDPAYDISIARMSGQPEICDDVVVEVIGETLRRHEVRAAKISVALVSDQQIALLNKKHLQHDRPTDVLAFDLRDAECDAGEEAVAVDGEIVVSVETAEREAARRAHGVEAEVSLYCVHAVLHLLGYDDKSRFDAQQMHIVENEILTAKGWGPVFDREVS